MVASSGDSSGGSGTAIETALSQSTGAAAVLEQGADRDGRAGVGLTQGTSNNGGQAVQGATRARLPQAQGEGGNLE